MSNGTIRSMGFTAGMTVLLPSYAGLKVKMADEQEYWIYRDDDILGILEEPIKQ